MGESIDIIAPVSQEILSLGNSVAARKICRGD